MAIQALGTNVNFTFEYALTLIIVILVCKALLQKTPEMNSLIVVIAGLVVGYLSLIVVNYLVPKLNKTASNVKQYYGYILTSNFNNMGYLNIWPPILAVLIIFIILLYNKNLG
jgi:ABC-type Fe3+-siderophore transport system permease subunit